MFFYRDIPTSRKIEGEYTARLGTHRHQPRARLIGWLLASCVLLMGGLFGPGQAPTAHAASTRLNDYNEIGVFPSPTFVQHHPKVYLIFWGPKWTSDTARISEIEQTFQTLAGSAYNNILTQYTDSSTSSDLSVPSQADYENGNYVHNDVELMTGPGTPYARVIDTTSPPGGIDIGVETNTGVFWGAQIRNEADKEIANLAWHVDRDSQIIVFPQQGTTYNTLSYPQNWCGMHVFNTTAVHQYAYAVVQYGDQNTSCGSSGADIAYVAVHEYAEAATDPVIHGILPTVGSGWHTPDTGQNSPQEVADLCGSLGSYVYSPVNGAGPFYLPYLWSNFDNACVTSVGREYVSPDMVYPFHGVHTVQGAILSKYGGGVIGLPITEETPIANGRVSYFNGTCGGTNECAGIYWSDATGAHFVRGAEFAEYRGVQEAAGFLGFPVTDDATIGSGSVTYFNGTCGGYVECAAIYWSSGSGAHFVRGAEFNEYYGAKEAVGFLGFPVTDDARIGNGSVTYLNGACGGTNKCAGIYWSDATGAHFVRGAEFTEYRKYQEAVGFLGFPVTDDATIGSGSVTYFNGTCGGYVKCAGIYWSDATGTHFVRGAEFSDYYGVNEAAGPLGFPLTDDASVPGGSATYFTANYACGTPGPSGSDGAIYWSDGTGAHEVHGCIYATYLNSFGGTGGMLGFPVSDEQGITAVGGNSGRVNYFAGGNCGNPGPYNSNSALYWTGSSGYEVNGCIYAKYVQIGGPVGVLGFPISNEYTNASGYRESDFEYGSIVWKNGTAVVYNGCKVSATVYTC